MKFSLFAPLGHFKFSSAKPLAKQFFELGKGAIGTRAYKIEHGSRAFAWLYAWSMALATLQMRMRRAGLQWHPAHVYEYLADHERDRGVIPRAGQTVIERRAELAWRRKLLPAPTRANVENALRERIGDAFLAFVPTSKDDAVTFPAACGDSPMLLTRADLPRAVAKTTTPIATVGVAQWVFYEQHSEGVAYELQDRDVVVIEPDVPERAERVSVTSSTAGEEAGYSIQITPTIAHPVGSTIARMPLPLWQSTKRHSLVILAESSAEDAETRRKANDVLERLMRGTSTWSLAGANEGDLTAGPFKVGVGKLGVTPIGEVTL